MGKYTDSFNDRLKITDKAHYYREQYQSYMTGPEWRNVEMVEEFAAFLRDKKSLFEFPYFRQVAELWKVLFRSFAAARKHNSFVSILFSEYMTMDLFVVLFTTFEFIPKGIVSLFLSPFLKKENPTVMQERLADFYAAYAKKLETIPFFDHDYKKAFEDLSKQYKEIKERTWVDWFSWALISLELRARHLISIPLRSALHQEDNASGIVTHIIVKFKSSEVHDPEEAKALFKDKLSQLGLKYALTLVGDDVYVKEKDSAKTYTSLYARLSVPRYMAFLDIVPALAAEGIHIRKIAGQDRVQVKTVITAEDAEQLAGCQLKLNKTKKVIPLYTYSDDIHSNQRFCLFDVPVRNLDKTLKRLEKESEVKFIHNF